MREVRKEDFEVNIDILGWKCIRIKINNKNYYGDDGIDYDDKEGWINENLGNI